MVGQVKYCAEGGADGGLVAFARVIQRAGGASELPVSPAGWYWSATLTRGVWSSPKRAESYDTAVKVVEMALSGVKADR